MTTDLDALARKLKPGLKPETFEHSMAVMREAGSRAGSFGADPEAARAGGLLHDCAKNLKPDQYLCLARAAGMEVFAVEQESPKVLHQRIGALWAREIYGVNDPGALAAIEHHTTARGLMGPLEKCLFVADYISGDRDFPGVETLRRAMGISPQRAFAAVLEFKVREVLRKGKPLHPWTIQAAEAWLPELTNMLYDRSGK